uniref:Uncharacterized protein n=1 Tax=Megaselia scalaris TaxID=36166 RepID=T1GJR8_MEGSC
YNHVKKKLQISIQSFYSRTAQEAYKNKNSFGKLNRFSSSIKVHNSLSFNSKNSKDDTKVRKNLQILDNIKFMINSSFSCLASKYNRKAASSRNLLSSSKQTQH